MAKSVLECNGISQEMVGLVSGLIDNIPWPDRRKAMGEVAVTMLNAASIAKLERCGSIQLTLFDKRDLASITHPDYPDERLVVFRNPELAKRRSKRREALLQATEKLLAEMIKKVERDSVIDPVKRSASAMKKDQTHRTSDGQYPVSSFRDILKTLSAITRSQVKVQGHKKGDFKTTSTPTPYQRKTLELLGISRGL